MKDGQKLGVTIASFQQSDDTEITDDMDIDFDAYITSLS